MYVHMYICLLFVNGLIQVMPKAVHTYVHHDRKPMCIAQQLLYGIKRYIVNNFGETFLHQICQDVLGESKLEDDKMEEDSSIDDVENKKSKNNTKKDDGSSPLCYFCPSR
jgi:hypothetical protein